MEVEEEEIQIRRDVSQATNLVTQCILQQDLVTRYWAITEPTRAKKELCVWLERRSLWF